MAWTYDTTFAASKDKVRFLCGDTNSADKLIQDEEINLVLVTTPNIYSAAAIVCRAICAKLRRRPTLTPTPGSISLDSQAQAKGFLELANTLDAQAISSGGADIFAGGISIGEKRQQDVDRDRVKPGFTVDKHHFSRTAAGSSGVIDFLDEGDV